MILKKIYNKPILSLSLFLMLISCGTPNSPYFDEILKSHQGHIRGVSISASVDEVLTNENEAFLEDQMEDYLFYDYELDMGNSYTVAYDFSEESLYEIEVAAYFDVIEDANLLFEKFEEHFTEKYGRRKIEDDGYFTWRTTSIKTKNRIEIAMINGSNTYGYISILVRDLDY